MYLIGSDDDAEDTKTSEQKKVAVRSRFADCKCDAMIKEELVKLCKERGVKISSVKYVEKQTLIDKLVKNDKFMEGWK